MVQFYKMPHRELLHELWARVGDRFWLRAPSGSRRQILARQSTMKPMTVRIRTIVGSQSESGRIVMNELLDAGLGGR